MEIVLVRHGQSGNNRLWEETGGLAGRHPDPRLTALGEQQAAAVAAWLAQGGSDRPSLDALHTSYMWRAVQTAAPIAQALDLPLLGHHEIFEVGGPYDLATDGTTTLHHSGATPAELRTLSDRLVADGLDTDAGWWPGPVEDWEAAAASRAKRVVAWLLATYDDSACVGLVTHGYFTQFLIRTLLGAESMTGWIHLDNTGVTRIVIDGDATVALVINGVEHLSPRQRSS